MSIDDETLEYVMTAATILKQRHVEMRRPGRLSTADSVSDPSNSNKTYVESTWYCHKQPCHCRALFPSTFSDSMENSSPANSACSSPDNSLEEYDSNNYNGAHTANGFRVSRGLTDLTAGV